MVENDIYLPHTCEEVRALVGPEVAAKLDPELGRKLTELESTRELARAELGRLLECRERVEELERDCDAVLESYAGMLPEAVDASSGEEEALYDAPPGGNTHAGRD